MSTLGVGGMGEVLLAEDDRLGRRVALKHPSAAFSQSPDALSRLRREARNAARLTHRAIAPIHDFIDVDGESFIVMEFVEGTDLSARIRDGAMAPDEALRVGIEIADALAVAHAQGVVHRDLKPANVRLTPDGQPKVLDFGLSRAPAPEAAPDAATLQGSQITEAGQIVGTPGYSAPEQLLGQPADQRADIFSLGVIVYELLTGRRAFEGRDSLARSLATLSSTPPPLRESHPWLPPALDTLLAQALAKDPAHRLSSAVTFRDELQRVRETLRDDGRVPSHAAGSTRPPLRASWRGRRAAWAAAGAAVAAAALVVAIVWRPAADPSSPARRSEGPTIVAVLPPANLTGEAANDLLAAGFADSLFNDLSGVPSMTIVPPAEVRQEVGRAGEDRRALVRSLGATYLVESSIQQSGDRLRINARLLGADGQVAWRRDYSGTTDAVFDLQRQLAEGLLEGLRLGADAEARGRIGTGRSADVAALNDYWRGRALLERPDLPEQVAGAVQAFEAAIARDPRFAEAHAGLAEACWVRYDRTREREWADRAVGASERALALDASQPRVWLTLALVHRGTGQLERAVDDLSRAIALQPTSDDAYRLKAEVLVERGQIDDALAAFDRAIDLRPGYWRNFQRKGIFLFQHGRLDEAAEAFHAVTRLQPDSASGYQALGAVQQTRGDLDAARASYERALAAGPSRAAYTNLGVIHHWQGRFREAVAAYEQAIAIDARAPLVHRNLGDAYTKLGDTPHAQAAYGVAASLLEQALEVNPKDVSALTDLAVCEAKLGHLERAQAHLARAAAVNAATSEVLYAEAVVAALAGRAEAAIALVERAVAAGTAVHLVERDDDLADVRRLPRYRTWLDTLDGRRVETGQPGRESSR